MIWLEASYCPIAIGACFERHAQVIVDPASVLGWPVQMFDDQDFSQDAGRFQL